RVGTLLRNHDAVCQRPDGTSFPVAYTLSPVETAGTAIGSVLAFRDMTERKREEEALRQLAEERASLVSTVSHALRAPIAAMLVNLEVLATSTLGELNVE